jgi:hypothetical protein
MRVVRSSLRLFVASVATRALVCSTTTRAQEATMATDTASSAESHGVANYYKTLVQISDGDVKAFAQFNSLTPFMDGAGAEGHSWDKWALLHVAGDDTFAKLLAGQSSKVREEYATHFAGPSETEPISNPKAYIKLHFPKTYSILYSKNAHQVNKK